MKIILALLPILPLLAFADERPPEWSLPNMGKDCRFEKSFVDGPRTCGTAAFQLWSCPDSDYLLVGSYKSDVMNVCSPTYVVEKAVPQAKPMR